MQIVSTDEWDPEFFASFNAIHAKLYGADPWVLNESVSDLAQLFGPTSDFAKDYYWRAWIAIERQEPTARLIACCHKHGATKFVSVGFLECLQDLDVAAKLFNAAEVWAQQRSDQQDCELRWPIQGHFFNGYRAPLHTNNRPPFLGEPHIPTQHIELVERLGYRLTERWETLELKRLDASQKLQHIWSRVEKRWAQEEITIRGIRPDHWQEELALLHEMFHESFDAMPNFTPISESLFYQQFESFKHFADPDLALIAERNGRAEAFVIGYFDPMPAIAKHQARMAGAFGKVPGFSLLSQLLMLKQLKSTNTNLLIPYIGKRASATAPWIVGALGYELHKRLGKRNIETAKICYLSERSAVRRSLPNTYEVVGEYGLYQKTISLAAG